MKNLFLLCLLGLIYSCQEENKPPTCTITSPSDGDDFEIGEVVTISVDADDPDGSVTEVRFYVDGSEVGSSDSFPYKYEWNTSDSEPGDHEIKAKSYDNEGLTSSDDVSIELILALPVPSVTTNSISDITLTTATGGGNVTDDGIAEVTARGVCWSTSSSPTTADSKTTDGSGTGSFTSAITGLECETTYYVRAYATNSEGTGYGDNLNFTTAVTDIDGNVYQNVQIGEQVWMAENLKATRYADGSSIPLVESTDGWYALTFTETDKAYCWYDNSDSLRDIYGGLYNWAAAMNGAKSSDSNPSGVQGACPDGWHLPSDAEWKELEMFLGMSQAEAEGVSGRGTDEGGKLKETGTTHWESPNTGATNESGFTALPGGYRKSNGFFDLLGNYAYFWTSTKDGASPWTRRLNSGSADVERVSSYCDCDFGFSVRCVKDHE